MSTLGTNTSGPLITTIDKAKEVRPEYTATAATNTVSIIALVRTASPISREYLACAAYLKWLCWFSVSHHSTPQLMLGILLLLLLLLLLSCFGLFVNADIGSIFGQDGYVFVFFFLCCCCFGRRMHYTQRQDTRCESIRTWNTRKIKETWFGKMCV